MRETKKEKDKAAANKRKSAAAPSTASKRRQSSQETPKGAKGEDDVDEVRTVFNIVIYIFCELQVVAYQLLPLNFSKSSTCVV